eukprot:1830699-Rhodomonas_salina.2
MLAGTSASRRVTRRQKQGHRQKEYISKHVGVIDHQRAQACAKRRHRRSHKPQSKCTRGKQNNRAHPELISEDVVVVDDSCWGLGSAPEGVDGAAVSAVHARLVRPAPRTSLCQCRALHSARAGSQCYVPPEWKGCFAAPVGG